MATKTTTTKKHHKTIAGEKNAAKIMKAIKEQEAAQ